MKPLRGFSLSFTHRSARTLAQLSLFLSSFVLCCQPQPLASPLATLALHAAVCRPLSSAPLVHQTSSWFLLLPHGHGFGPLAIVGFLRCALFVTTNR